MPKIVDRAARRADLALAAATAFAERGVADTTISDIVKAAGVAQGTFYLYFDSKSDVLVAVVDQIANAMLAAIEAAVSKPGATAVEKLLGLRDVLTGFDADRGVVELADFIHRPENRALHDRLTEHLATRMVSLVEEIIVRGIAEGSFDVPDPHAAAWFVGAGLQSIELAGTAAADMPKAIEAATDLALRTLGYRGATS
ncbi:MAG: TetR/AcrR family transcriptional regulator [Coriobacteriia bacterium]|nr:TetR/AcrR family transcriptional regulator [Coriobacteriia bacterium]